MVGRSRRLQGFCRAPVLISTLNDQSRPNLSRGKSFSDNLSEDSKGLAHGFTGAQGKHAYTVIHPVRVVVLNVHLTIETHIDLAFKKMPVPAYAPKLNAEAEYRCKPWCLTDISFHCCCVETITLGHSTVAARPDTLRQHVHH